MAHFLSGMAERHRVALLYLRAADEPPVAEALRRKCDLVEEIVRPIPNGSGAGGWKALLFGRPLWARAWAVPAYADTLRRLALSWQPDIVHVDYHIMGQYLSTLDGCPAPRILVEHDPGTRRAWEEWRSRWKMQPVISFADLIAWYQFERAVMKQVDTVVAFTERDRRSLGSVARSTPVVTIPLAFPVPPRALDPFGGQPPSLLYVGNFVHRPNVAGAMCLARSLFPRLRERHSDLKLYIVGENPPHELQRLSNGGVVVTGFVPDVTPFLDRATVVTAPLHMGGGMRVKVLEALAAGKALVASPLAIAGLELVSGREVLVADGDDELCRAIDRLLQDPELRVAVARRARAWGCAHLGVEKSVAAYDRLYRRLLAERKGS
jgi:glycosyltransferase involved in cell wall biosynthesis